MDSIWLIVGSMQVVLMGIGLAASHYLLCRPGPRPPEPQVGAGSELLAMTAAHRAALQASIAPHRQLYGTLSLVVVLVMNALTVLIGQIMPRPELFIIFPSIAGAALAAGIGFYGRILNRFAADDMAGGWVIRTIGPIEIQEDDEGQHFKTVHARFGTSVAVANALRGKDTTSATAEYAPSSQIVFEVWDADRRSLYRDLHYFPTNTPPSGLDA